MLRRSHAEVPLQAIEDAMLLREERGARRAGAWVPRCAEICIPAIACACEGAESQGTCPIGFITPMSLLPHLLHCLLLGTRRRGTACTVYLYCVLVQQVIFTGTKSP